VELKYPNIERVLNDMQIAFIQELASVGISAQSSLAQSAEVKRTDEPNKTIYENLFNYYFYWVAYGRGPTQQGTQPGKLKAIILEWIKRRGIEPRPDENGKTISKEALAYLITRKIHEQGFQPRDFITPVVERFESELDEAFAKDFEDNINLILANI
jgi:hypothetical protein